MDLINELVAILKTVASENAVVWTWVFVVIVLLVAVVSVSVVVHILATIAISLVTTRGRARVLALIVSIPSAVLGFFVVNALFELQTGETITTFAAVVSSVALVQISFAAHIMWGELIGSLLTITNDGIHRGAKIQVDHIRGYVTHVGWRNMRIIDRDTREVHIVPYSTVIGAHSVSLMSQMAGQLCEVSYPAYHVERHQLRQYTVNVHAAVARYQSDIVRQVTMQHEKTHFDLAFIDAAANGEIEVGVVLTFDDRNGKPIVNAEVYVSDEVEQDDYATEFLVRLSEVGVDAPPSVEIQV